MQGAGRHKSAGSLWRAERQEKRPAGPVYASLDAAGIPYVSLGGVKPNPRLSLVYEGIELCKREGVDFLLPVGGGSVITRDLVFGYGLANDFDVWDLYDRKNTAKACAPLGAVADHRRGGQRDERFQRYHQGGGRHQAGVQLRPVPVQVRGDEPPS